MKAELLIEPELQFGAGTHVDIRFGLKNYGPITFDDPAAPREIRLGFVGTPTTIQGVKDWLETARKGIAAKESKKPNLFPAFPGFGATLASAASGSAHRNSNAPFHLARSTI